MNRQLRVRVLRRDRWQCQMPVCLHPVADGGRAIAPGLPPDDPWAASADHVIPKAYGGPGRMENLRAAHRLCNAARGSGALVRELAGVARGSQGGVLRAARGGLLADPRDAAGPRWAPA